MTGPKTGGRSRVSKSAKLDLDCGNPSAASVAADLCFGNRKDISFCLLFAHFELSFGHRHLVLSWECAERLRVRASRSE